MLIAANVANLKAIHGPKLVGAQLLRLSPKRTIKETASSNGQIDFQSHTAHTTLRLMRLFNTIVFYHFAFMI